MKKKPTLNRPGVTVFFPGCTLRHETAAYRFLVERGVSVCFCLLTPTFSAGGARQFVFYGGR